MGWCSICDSSYTSCPKCGNKCCSCVDINEIKCDACKLVYQYKKLCYMCNICESKEQLITCENNRRLFENRKRIRCEMREKLEEDIENNIEYKDFCFKINKIIEEDGNTPELKCATCGDSWFYYEFSIITVFVDYKMKCYKCGDNGPRILISNDCHDDI